MLTLNLFTLGLFVAVATPLRPPDAELNKDCYYEKEGIAGECDDATNSMLVGLKLKAGISAPGCRPMNYVSRDCDSSNQGNGGACKYKVKDYWAIKCDVLTDTKRVTFELIRHKSPLTCLPTKVEVQPCVLQTAQQECADRMPQCANWKLHGRCTAASYVKYMRTHCRRTCNIDNCAGVSRGTTSYVGPPPIGCQYKQTPGPCDAATNTRLVTMELIVQESDAGCVATKLVKKSCAPACKYTRREMKCDPRTNTRMISFELVADKSPLHCDAKRLESRPCAVCKYKRRESPCDPTTNTRMISLELIADKSPRHCDAKRLESQPCQDVGACKYTRREMKCDPRTNTKMISFELIADKSPRHCDAKRLESQPCQDVGACKYTRREMKCDPTTNTKTISLELIADKSPRNCDAKRLESQPCQGVGSCKYTRREMKCDPTTNTRMISLELIADKSPRNCDAKRLESRPCAVPVVVSCKDKYPQCANWKRAGYCDPTYEFSHNVRPRCMRSCNVNNCAG